MNILVCVKRVPVTGGRITVTADRQEIDTRFLGFTVSPHEECAAEEAVRIVEKHAGASTVLTLGPEVAIEQLRDLLAIGVNRGVLLETDGAEWDATATAAAIVGFVRARADAGEPFDLLLFGNEAADTGDFQVGIRVAMALDLPCVVGAKAIEIGDGSISVQRDAGGSREIYEVPLPAVVATKEGINLPRYPSVPGRLRAKKQEIERMPVTAGAAADPAKVALTVPVEGGTAVEILGTGPEAAPKVVELLQRIGVLAR